MRRFVILGLAALAGCAEAGGPPGSGGGADSGAAGGDGGAPDAPAASDPDARVPDATPVPDADPPDADPPDAEPPCTVQDLALLTNAGFDLGATGWNQSSSGGFSLIEPSTNLPIVPHTPDYAAWLGGYDSGSDELWQTVIVPPDATAFRFTGYRIIGTEEAPGIPYDHLYLRIKSSTGVLLEELAHFTNVDSVASWTSFDYTAGSSYAGQTVRISLQATTDITLNTNFFIDTLGVAVTVCR